MDRLMSLEDAELAAEHGEYYIKPIAKQLADLMRENERLQGLVGDAYKEGWLKCYGATPEPHKAGKDYINSDAYKRLSNKDSENG
jgi:hypothetical protein